MSNYLLEIGTEEIPAGFMPGALTQLSEMAVKRLEERRISYGKLQTMGTPRRITLLVYDLADKEADLKEEVRGPAQKAAFDANGKPTKAAEGFARSQGVPVDQLVTRVSGATEYVYALREVQGRPTREVIPEFAVQLIQGLNFPKPMRWGSQEMRFARPIRWLVSLLDREVIPFSAAGLAAGRYSRGHRFLGNNQIDIKDPLTYVQQLTENYVLVDQSARRAECWKQIQEIADAAGGYVEKDEELLDEVTHLLEWPTALMGKFSTSYLAMPKEVIITPMREHQRYFPVMDNNGKLENAFITIRNGNGEALQTVQAGNERVLNARLADARFFWDEDRKLKLEEYLPKLEKIVFQESLGTVAQKTQRVMANTQYLGEYLEIEPKSLADAVRAAKLAKADLVTNMVYEFPELQGIMGRYYAQLSGEREAVAEAVLEHYQPRFAGDKIPDSIVGALVSIADKLDTIAGCFAIGIEPTGSQDPYALRRQAMGICLILTGHKLELKLDDIIKNALAQYTGILPDGQLGKETSDKIKEFFQPRLKNILMDEGYRYDIAEAVLGVDYNLVTATLERAKALHDLKEDPGFQDMLTSFTRAYNLSRKAAGLSVDPACFLDESEKELFDKLETVKNKIQRMEQEKKIAGMISEISTLADPINRFFTAVMVMVEDEKVKNNRLGLLNELVELTRKIGDLSKIVV